VTQVIAALLLLGAFVVILSPPHGPDLWETCRRKVGSDLLWLGLRTGHVRLMRLGLRVRGGFDLG
jgi:hypothetical protein